MAEAVVTWKLTPDEARLIRDELIERTSEIHELAREIRGENPRNSAALSKQEERLHKLLEKI